MHRLDRRHRLSHAPALLAFAAVLCGVAAAAGTVLFAHRASGASLTAYPSAVLADGPAGYWRLGESAGVSAAADSSGGGHPGTYSQVTAGAAGSLVTDPDTAATFTGGPQSAVAVPTSSPLDFGSGSFAVDAWVRTTAASGTIVGKSPGFGKPPCGNDQSGGTYGPGWALTLAGSTVKALAADGTVIHGACFTPRVVSVSGPAGVVVNDGRWHYVVASFDRSAGLVTVSVDGQTASAALSLSAGVSNSSPLVIGGQIPSGSPGLAGSIDEVAVYPHALAGSRVQARLIAAAAPLAGQMPDSSQLTTPVLVSGTVDDSPDAARSIGTVAVLAWPKKDIVTAATPGTSISLTLVAQGYVTSSGSFALRPGPSVNLASFADSDGSADFMVLYRGLSSWGHSAFSATVAPPTGPAGPVSDASDPDTNVGQPSDEPAPDSDPDGDLPATPDVGESEDLPSTIAELHLPVEAAAPTAGAAGIFAVLEEIYPPRPVRIGETFTLGPSLKARFTYLRTAHTTLGIGFRNMFQNGFTASGTTTETATVGADFGYMPPKTNQAYYASWQFARYSIWVGDPFASHLGDEVRPYALTGGFTRRKATDIPTPVYCDPESPGVTFSRVRKKLKTFAGGVSISDLIGVNLSSQTGASQQAALYYHFGQAGHMCGNNGHPADSRRVRGLVP